MFDLVFIDLDGTLLTREGRITPRSRAAVAGLLDRGVCVVLASGRPWRMLRAYLDELGINGPVICYNGAQAVAADGVVLWERRLTSETAQAAFDLLRVAGAYDFLCEADDYLAGELPNDPLVAAQRRSWGLSETATLAEGLCWGPYKLMAHCPPSRQQELANLLLNRLRGRISLTTSMPGSDWLEILHPEANKARAAEELSRQLGFDLSRAAAFGDAENDLALLARVGLGVAMANADPRVKAVAKIQAPSNEEDGLAQVVEEFLAAG